MFPISFLLLNILQNVLTNLSYTSLLYSSDSNVLDSSPLNLVFSIVVQSIRIFNGLLILIALGHRWTLLPLTVRRIRDVGMKWQWIFFVSIPLLGDIFVLIFLTRPSVEEINGKKYFPKY